MSLFHDWMETPDWMGNGLPTFDGGKDRALARKMIDGLGGPSGFKTSQRTDADGTITTVQLKGSMPPQVTVFKPAVAVTPPDFVEIDYLLRQYHDEHLLYTTGSHTLPFQYLKTVFLVGGYNLNLAAPPEDKLENADYYAAVPKRSLDGVFKFFLFPPKRATITLGAATIATLNFDAPGGSSTNFITSKFGYYTKAWENDRYVSADMSRRHARTIKSGVTVELKNATSS